MNTNTNMINNTKEERKMNTNYTYAHLYLDCNCVAYDTLATILDYYQAAPAHLGELFITTVAYDPDYPYFIDTWFKQEIESNLTAMDADYEEILEAMREADYEELADSDLPF